MKRYQLKVTDVELLVVRNLKRNTENDGVLRRIVSLFYALSHDSITKDMIFDCLLDILLKYDLLPHSEKDENLRYFFTHSASFAPSFEKKIDEWLWKAKTYIRQSKVYNFPSYSPPAYFRNAMKKREEFELREI